MKLSTLASEGVAIILLLVAAGLIIFYSYVYYREAKQTRRLTRRQVWLLRLLRITAAILVVFALARPTLIVTRRWTQAPAVPILIDGSQSMSFDDARENPLCETARQSRYESAKIALDKLAGPLARKHDLKVYKFSHDLKLVTSIDARGEKGGREVDKAAKMFPDIEGKPDSATGSMTDIKAAGIKALSGMGDSKVSGLILITDGRSTTGTGDTTDKQKNWALLSELVELARSDRVHVPIHTVVMGSENALRDLRIDDFNCPAEASLGDVLSFQVKITNQIDDILNTELTLYEADAEAFKKANTPEDIKKIFTEVARRKLRLTRGQQTIPISCIPETLGDRVFRAVLPVVADEVNTDNNTAVVSVKVAKRNLKVLLIAGEPSREYIYMVPALLRDPVVILSCYLQSADVDYIQQGNENIERLPQSTAEWRKYDVAMLLDVDPNGFNTHPLTVQQIAGLEEMVAKGGGLMVMGGRSQGLAKLLQVHAAKLRLMLPVEIDKNRPLESERFYDRPFRAERTKVGRDHPIMRVSGDEKKNEEIWGTFPQFYWYHPVVKAMPKAVVLMQTAGGAGAPAGECLMAVHRYGEGSVFYCGLDSLWLWRYPYESYDYDRFWTRTIRYLGEAKLSGTQQQVSLATDRRSYAPGQNVAIQLRILDPALDNQLQNVKLYAKVVTPQKEEHMVELQRAVDGQAAFTGNFQSKRVGTMTVVARHQASDSEAKDLFKVECNFQVQHQSLEAMDTSADIETMKQLSEATGGKHFDYHNMSKLESLIDEIPADPKVITRRDPIDIWDGLTFLLIFLVLVSAEWSLRKWWGLL
ncbi:MAG: hypothetical protein PHU85_00725 [Phycisphaerae bacterium]|nr:hypothetical protein [Phycisphaerae bacterium]